MQTTKGGSLLLNDLHLPNVTQTATTLVQCIISIGHRLFVSVVIVTNSRHVTQMLDSLL